MLRLELVVLSSDGAQLLDVLPSLLAVREACPARAAARLAQEVLAIGGALDDGVQEGGEGGAAGRGDELVGEAEEAQQGADGARLEAVGCNVRSS